MDFGGFILWILMAAGCFGLGAVACVAFLGRRPGRWIGLGVVGAGLIAAMVFGFYLYHIYWIDERLFMAAAGGDAAEVEALLAAGACPDSEWEDGTPAVAAASRTGRADVVAILRRAGAVAPASVLGGD